MGAALLLLAVLLLLCTSNGLLNSKSQAGIMTLGGDGFNDVVADEEDRSYNATLSDPATNYTTYEEGAYELGGAGPMIAGKRRKKKKRTFDLQLTMFRGVSDVLVTPVSFGSQEEGRHFFVGFDVAASNSWMYGVAKDSGGKQSKMDSAPQTGREETPYHSYAPRSSTDNTHFTNAFFDGEIVSDSLGLLLADEKVHDFEFISAATVNPISFTNRAATFDGLLGLGLKAEKEWRGITDPGGGKKVGGKWVTVAGDKMYPGTSLFHRLAGGKNGGGVLKKPAVAFYVSPCGMSGEITFGGHKKEYLALVEGNGKKEAKREKMFYIPVVTSTPSIPDWTLKSHYLSVGPNKGGNLIAENFNVVFMTTVHHAFMTSSREIFESLPSAFGEGVQVLTEGAFKDNYQLIVDCTARDNLPTLQLKLKSKLDKKVYSFTGREVFPVKIEVEGYEDQCASFFKLVTDFGDYGLPPSKYFEWAIGTDFMKKYYVEFSLSKRPDVPAYIGIGRSSETKLTYSSELTRAPPPCPRSPDKGEKKEKFEAVLDPDSNDLTLKIVDEGQSAAPDSDQPSSSSSTHHPPSSSSSDHEEEDEAPRSGGNGEEGNGGVHKVVSIITGHVDKHGVVTIGKKSRDAVEQPPGHQHPSSPSSSDDEDHPLLPARSRNWRRWAAAGAMAACAVAGATSNRPVGGEIITIDPPNKQSQEERAAVLYFDGDGRIMVGRMDENNHVEFVDGPPPKDAVPASELYGGVCKQVLRGDQWKLDCADGYGDNMWAYQLFDE